MGKFSGYVLCSDIDGTLISTSHKIPDKNLEAIKYFRELGGKFTLATGRIPKSVAQFIPIVNPDLPIIASNGCCIYDFSENKYLWCMSLPEGAEDFAKEIIKNHPESSCGVINMEGTFFLNTNKSAEDLCEIENFPLVKSTLDKIEKPWIKFLFCQEPKLTTILRDKYSESSYHKKYKAVQSGATYYEYFNLNANKGVALKKLAEMFGFSMEKVIAIGDNENDADMIRAAKYGAAVENAYDIAKNAATIITCSNNDGSIYDLVEKMDLIL